jgi:Na+-driven multidrug efflux pump
LFAAHNIAMQFLSLTFSLADGTGIAATALVGQNLGARRPDKSMLYGKIAQRIAQVISAVVGILLVVLRFPIAGLFIQAGTPDAGVVVEAAAQTLIVIALMQPFQMGSVVLSGSLRGAGDNMFVAGVMALCVSIIRPLMAVLAVYVFHFGLALTWLFGLSEIALRLFLFVRRFQSGKWMTINV